MISICRYYPALCAEGGGRVNWTETICCSLSMDVPGDGAVLQALRKTPRVTGNLLRTAQHKQEPLNTPPRRRTTNEKGTKT